MLKNIKMFFCAGNNENGFEGKEIEEKGAESTPENEEVSVGEKDAIKNEKHSHQHHHHSKKHEHSHKNNKKDEKHSHGHVHGNEGKDEKHGHKNDEKKDHSHHHSVSKNKNDGKQKHHEHDHPHHHSKHSKHGHHSKTSNSIKHLSETNPKSPVGSKSPKKENEQKQEVNVTFPKLSMNDYSDSNSDAGDISSSSAGSGSESSSCSQVSFGGDGIVNKQGVRLSALDSQFVPSEKPPKRKKMDEDDYSTHFKATPLDGTAAPLSKSPSKAPTKPASDDKGREASRSPVKESARSGVYWKPRESTRSAANENEKEKEKESLPDYSKPKESLHSTASKSNGGGGGGSSNSGEDDDCGKKPPGTLLQLNAAGDGVSGEESEYSAHSFSMSIPPLSAQSRSTSADESGFVDTFGAGVVGEFGDGPSRLSVRSQRSAAHSRSPVPVPVSSRAQVSARSQVSQSAKSQVSASAHTHEIEREDERDLVSARTVLVADPNASTFSTQE